MDACRMMKGYNMKLIETGEINRKGIHGKVYDTDRSLSIDDIISIIKGYEDENTIRI